MIFTHDGRQKPVHNRIIRLHNTHPAFLACVRNVDLLSSVPILKNQNQIIVPTQTWRPNVPADFLVNKKGYMACILSTRYASLH